MPFTRREFVAGCCTGLIATWDERILAAPASRLDYEVPGYFALLRQIGNTCWATTGTMMYNWKHNSMLSVDELSQRAGSRYADLYSQRAILPFALVPSYFSFLGLQAKPPASYPPSAIAQMLMQYGLLWATTMQGAVACPMLVHARIIRGIHGNDDGSDTTITVVDPTTGSESSEKMSAFYQEFEGYARAEQKCDPTEPLAPQVLHF